MHKYIQITTTVSKIDDAKKIADKILEKKIAACVQISGPIKSIYWWKNKIENEEEWYCFIKTKKKLYNKIEKMIKKMHAYETPEIIATPIIKGSNEYLRWLDDTIQNK